MMQNRLAQHKQKQIKIPQKFIKHISLTGFKVISSGLRTQFITDRTVLKKSPWGTELGEHTVAAISGSGLVLHMLLFSAERVARLYRPIVSEIHKDYNSPPSHNISLSEFLSGIQLRETLFWNWFKPGLQEAIENCMNKNCMNSWGLQLLSSLGCSSVPVLLASKLPQVNSSAWTSSSK